MTKIIVVLFMNTDIDTYIQLLINCRGISSIFNYHAHDILMQLLANTRSLISAIRNYPEM